MRRLILRLIAAFIALAVAGSASAQVVWPPAAAQLRSNPAAGRTALDFPATSPGPTRAPRITDNYEKGYAVNDVWLGPDGRTWQALSVNPYGLWVPIVGGAKRPFDGQTAPAVLYGTRLLISTYTGPALRLRDSGGTTLDIAFRQDDTIDVDAADNFCFATIAAGSLCEITIWYDQSGNARDATATTGNAPVWDPRKRLNGQRVVSFQSRKQAIGSGGPPAVSQYMTIPAFAWTPTTSSFLMAGWVNNGKSDGDEFALLGDPSNQVGWAQSAFSGGIYGIGITGSVDLVIPTTPSVWTVSNSSGFMYVHMNGLFDSKSHNSASATSGALLGFSTHSNYTGALMDLGAFALWTSTLSTSSTEPAIITPVERSFNIQRQADHIVVVIGASDAAGTGSTSGSSWSEAMSRLMDPGVRLYNEASHGRTLPNVLANFTQFVTDLHTIERSSTVRNFVIVQTAVGNDIRSDRTLAQIKADIQSFVTQAKALGSNIKVILGTKTYACDYKNDPTQIEVLQGYNDWIRSSATVPIASGGAGADGYADQAANPLVDDGLYDQTVIMCQSAISYDGVHLNDPYQASMAPIWWAAIRGVLK